MKLSYVLPVHNEAAILRANVSRLAEGLRGVPQSEIILVENGSNDDSWPLCEELAEERHAVPVRAFREPMAGIGYAYHRGLTETISGGDADSWVVLTAADLPFGLTDLEAFREARRAGSSAGVFIGSKAHRRSHVEVTLQRRMTTLAYRVLRRAILGMKTADSQGSVFVRGDLGAHLLPRMRARGFFYSTELVYLTELSGVEVVELPVTLAREQRRSTVRPLQQGVVMFSQLWELRRRTARERRG